MTSNSAPVPRRVRSAALRAAGLSVAALALAGCVTPYVARIPNPDSLPPEAVNLRALVVHGCLPIAEGRRIPADWMPKLGFTRRVNFSWPDPPGLPSWMGHWRGIPIVTTSDRYCQFTVRGSDFTTYEQVMAKVLHDGLGVEPDDIRLSDRFKTPLPGMSISIPAMYSGCARGVGFSYSEVNYRGRLQFDVAFSGHGCSGLPGAATR